MEIVRLTAIIIMNWFLKEIGTPPSTPMGATEGDRPAVDGKPYGMYNFLSPIYILALLYYGQNYLGSNFSLFYDVVPFVVATAGYLLRRWAYQTLGEFHTFELGIKKNHRLITSGPYQYLVHPSYAGQCLFLVGSLIFLRSPVGLLAIFIILFGYIVYTRIKIEASAMQDHFGKDYTDYCSTRKLLIPYIW